MNYREITLREAIHFKNGKKRPTSEVNIPVYGGNGVLGYAGESNYEHCIQLPLCRHRQKSVCV